MLYKTRNAPAVLTLTVLGADEVFYREILAAANRINRKRKSNGAERLEIVASFVKEMPPAGQALTAGEGTESVADDAEGTGKPNEKVVLNLAKQFKAAADVAYRKIVSEGNGAERL